MTTEKQRISDVPGGLLEGFSDLPKWEFRGRRIGLKSYVVAATDNGGNRLEFVGTNSFKLKAWVHKILLRFETFGFHPREWDVPEN